MLEQDSLDFSFSGIKTAVKREIDSRKAMSLKDQQELSFEIEETITNILSKKLMRAREHTGSQMILLAGGVSANNILRSKLETLSRSLSIPFLAPMKILYSMDNAAMVGIRAYMEVKSTIQP
jgi:N6-L-threonylcarbamoyladenine synthase